MKIIKYFEDPEFLRNPLIFAGDTHNHKWLWGLADNGKIYYRWFLNHDPLEEALLLTPNCWFDLGKNPIIAPHVGLKEMKKIVKEFGHLLVFL